MGNVDEKFFEAGRNRMVAEQLMGRGISSAKVLHVMGTLARERFLPDELRGRAYEDGALGVAEGQTISQPYVVALMSQLLEVRPTDRVLEIGTGTGYQTAVLAMLAEHGEVCTVERFASLSEGARKVLAELGIGNVRFIVGDGSLGWPTEGSGERGEGLDDILLSPDPSPLTPLFDRILITAGAPSVPGPVVGQLKEGGILVGPTGLADHQRLVVMRKAGGAVTEKAGIPVRFVPLVGRYGWRAE